MNLTRPLLAASLRSWYAPDLRRVGPWWLQLVWTLLFCMVVAVGFTVIGFALYASGEGAWRNLRGWAYWYGKNLVVSMTIGFLIHALFEGSAWLIGKERIKQFSNPVRGLYFSGIPLLGVAIGWPAGIWLGLGGNSSWFRLSDANTIAGSLLVSMVICAVFYVYFDARAKQMMAEQRAAEAQLRLLQGQIEPHFLFNTLANVLALIDHDAPKARSMLEAFIDYLRTSLGTMRRDAHAAGAELDLVDAYLHLLQMRMEGRLRYRIEADDAARAVPLPPLLLQPLVENAITHGLEPKVEGGEVVVRVRRDADTLVLEVRDDGLGLDAPRRRGTRPGAGMALQNIRERLVSLYGSAASLDLSALPVGTMATLRLPLTPA